MTYQATKSGGLISLMTWEISRPAGRRAAAPARDGKAEKAVADDERTGEVGPLHSSGGCFEQSRATGAEEGERREGAKVIVAWSPVTTGTRRKTAILWVRY
jgi:hypothetical protein